MVLDHIAADSILLHPVYPEIFYFKHGVESSLIIIFIGNPDVETSATLS